MKDFSKVRIALVHDWLNGMRGGEKILEILADIFPDAHVFTLFHEKDKVSPAINRLKINTSFIQKMPFVKTHYRYYLPLFPYAIEKFRLKEYDLVISTSHCVAKGVMAPPGSLHVCYCLTPIRYVWEFDKEYFSYGRFFLRPILNRLKAWDKRTSERPNAYLSISQTVAGRLKRYYNKESTVVYPPVDTDFFVPKDKNGGYYLIVSALVPYKRIDIAIDAFNKLGYNLKIIGVGAEYDKLRKKAAGNIEFLGWQNNDVLRDYYAECKAFIFPGIEDFGITVLEAQSCGRPVAAFRRGGAMETIDENIPTGVFFNEQSSEALAKAVEKIENDTVYFDKQKIRQHALKFNKGSFREKIKNEIQRLFDLHYGGKSGK